MAGLEGSGLAIGLGEKKGLYIIVGLGEAETAVGTGYLAGHGSGADRESENHIRI